MKILYEESPKSFEEVLISLLPSDTKLTCQNSKEVAELLNGKSWSDFKS
jgi:hypothetical protein